MIAPRLHGFVLRHALLLLALLATAFAATGLELHHLACSRGRIQARGQGNTNESRYALLAQDLLSQEDAAIRDVVLATAPLEIRQAEARFDAIDLHYDRTQAVLLKLFANDAATTPEELALLGQLLSERRAMEAPIDHVLELARVNEDGPASQALIRDVMPHQKQLHALLGELDLAQQKQNLDLARIADAEYGVALATTVVLAVVGVLLAGVALLVAARPRVAKSEA